MNKHDDAAWKREFDHVEANQNRSIKIANRTLDESVQTQTQLMPVLESDDE